MVLNLSRLKSKEKGTPKGHWYVEYLEQAYEMETADGPQVGSCWVALVTNGNRVEEKYGSPRNRPMSLSEVKVWVGQVVESEAFRLNLRNKAKKNEV